MLIILMFTILTGLLGIKVGRKRICLARKSRKLFSPNGLSKHFGVLSVEEISPVTFRAPTVRPSKTTLPLLCGKKPTSSLLDIILNLTKAQIFARLLLSILHNPQIQFTTKVDGILF